MKHVYLSEMAIKKALVDGAITAQEADKLKVRMNAQVYIFEAINKKH